MSSTTPRTRPFIIVFGNVKGGTGKSTLAFHSLIALAYHGKDVTSIDIDGRQGTFSRYLENRHAYAKGHKDLPTSSTHLRLCPLLHEDITPLKEQLDHHIAHSTQEIIIIDTPGNDSLLSQYAHSLADLLITPINDSYIDLDLLMNVGASVADNGRMPLSTYATMVWEQRLKKTARQDGALEWMIIRNRMNSIASKNRVHIETLIENLAKRIGFHLCNGVGERVIFRELFGHGLTLLDKEERRTTLSHVAARQELRVFLDAILHFYEKFLHNHSATISTAA